MQLLSVWIDSLKLLKPKNFKLFIGAMLLATARTYRTWLGIFWPYILLTGILSLYYPVCLDFLCTVPCFGSLVNFKFNTLFQEALYLMLISTVCLSARPSVNIKNIDYFLERKKHIFVMVLWLFLVKTIGGWVNQVDITLLDATAPMFEDHCAMIVWLLLNILWLYCVYMVYVSITLCTLFFIADSSGSIFNLGTSIARASRMVFFAFPFLLVAGMALTACFTLVILVFALLNHIFVSSLTMTCFFGYAIHILVLPIWIAFFATLYIKRLYDNSALYLK